MVGGDIKKLLQTFSGSKCPFSASGGNRLALISTFKPLEQWFLTF